MRRVPAHCGTFPGKEMIAMTYASQLARAANSAAPACWFVQSALSACRSTARLPFVAVSILLLLSPPSILCQTVERWGCEGLPGPYPSVQAACDAALQQLARGVKKPVTL